MDDDLQNVTFTTQEEGKYSLLKSKTKTSSMKGSFLQSAEISVGGGGSFFFNGEEEKMKENQVDRTQRQKS
jgi:hypothetical protein